VELVRKHTPIDGACHCRNIRFVLRWPDSEPVIAVRKCGCTFCHKHAGAWTSHRSAELVVEINDRSLVSNYNFGTKTADFCVCTVCGVVPFVLCEIDDRQYAVVNVNTFQEVGSFSFSSAPTNFDGEDTKGRLDRRKRNWISNVRLDGFAT
jgi:hypothetical protein